VEEVRKKLCKNVTSPRKSLAQLALETYVCIMATEWKKIAEFASV